MASQPTQSIKSRSVTCYPLFRKFDLGAVSHHRHHLWSTYSASLWNSHIQALQTSADASNCAVVIGPHSLMTRLACCHLL